MKTQIVLQENLFSGYFEHGADIGSRQFLSEQAVKAGVFSSVEECKEWLATDAKKQASVKMRRRAVETTDREFAGGRSWDPGCAAARHQWYVYLLSVSEMLP